MPAKAKPPIPKPRPDYVYGPAGKHIGRWPFTVVVRAPREKHG